MAKATITRAEAQVTLTLSEKEARVLYSILRKIGGSPHTTPRKYSDSILNGLRPVAAELELQDDFLCAVGAPSSIHFADRPGF